MNGWNFEPSEDDAFATLILVSKGELDAESIERWIARNLSRQKEIDAEFEALRRWRRKASRRTKGS